MAPPSAKSNDAKKCLSRISAGWRFQDEATRRKLGSKSLRSAGPSRWFQVPRRSFASSSSSKALQVASPNVSRIQTRADLRPHAKYIRTHWHGWHLNWLGRAVSTTDTEYSLSGDIKSSYDCESSLITPSLDCRARVDQCSMLEARARGSASRPNTDDMRILSVLFSRGRVEPA